MSNIWAQLGLVPMARWRGCAVAMQTERVRAVGPANSDELGPPPTGKLVLACAAPTRWAHRLALEGAQSAQSARRPERRQLACWRARQAGRPNNSQASSWPLQRSFVGAELGKFDEETGTSGLVPVARSPHNSWLELGQSGRLDALGSSTGRPR